MNRADFEADLACKLDGVRSAQPGARARTLLSAANAFGRAVKGGLIEDKTAAAQLLEVAPIQQHGVRPFRAREAARVVAKGLARGAGRVRGLVLADTQVGADDEAAHIGREKLAQDVLREGTEVLVERQLPRLLRPSAPADLRASVARSLRANRPAGVAAALRGMASTGQSRHTFALQWAGAGGGGHGGRSHPA